MKRGTCRVKAALPVAVWPPFEHTQQMALMNPRMPYQADPSTSDPIGPRSRATRRTHGQSPLVAPPYPRAAVNDR